MTKASTFIYGSVIVAALTAAPLAAQSTSGQARPQAEQDKNRDKVTSTGEKVGEDVPAAGTQTDQRGRTAADGAKVGTGALQGADHAFLVDAMQGNRAEVALAKMAQSKADSEAVRNLAKTLEEHHQKANDKLTSIASKVGASDNATAPKPEHKQLQERLSRLEAAAFDNAYASEMVKEHEKDIAKYQKASQQLQHAELKAYATETLPTLKQHLEQARTALSQVSSPKTK